MSQAVEIENWAKTSDEWHADGTLGWNTPAGLVAQRLPAACRAMIVKGLRTSSSWCTFFLCLIVAKKHKNCTKYKDPSDAWDFYFGARERT